MAVKGGQILHVGRQFVVDRIQTAGPGNLGIPEERIAELGNYETVATIRDIPDITFDLESLDMSTEIEAILTGVDAAVAAMPAGTEFDFSDAKPLDIISPFKGQGNSFTIVAGVALPHLTLESAAYRFGLRQNSTQAFTLRGDSIFYIPGTPYYEQFTVPGVAGEGPYTFGETAIRHVSQGEDLFALSIRLRFADGTTRRLFRGSDFTNTAAGFTLAAAPAAGTIIEVVYGSLTSADYPQTVHQDATVKPATVRGKDINVYVGPQGGPLVRWPSVQGADVNWRVNLDTDEEFGNPQAVSKDYDTAEVNGTITIRPQTVQELFARIAEVTSTPADEIAGVFTSELLEVEIQVNHPETGARLKTLLVDDARFQPPAIQGRVNTKTETGFPFASDGGKLLVYAGARP
jgi:hypothetical protein